MMSVQLRRLLVHDLLRGLHGASMLQSWWPIQVIGVLFFGYMLLLLLGVFVEEQVHDGPFSRRSLVDGKGICKLVMCTNLDGIEQLQCKVLAVVTYEIVGWSFCSHLVYRHFT